MNIWQKKNGKRFLTEEKSTREWKSRRRIPDWNGNGHAHRTGNNFWIYHDSFLMNDFDQNCGWIAWNFNSWSVRWHLLWIEKCWMPIKNQSDPRSHASHTKQSNHECNKNEWREIILSFYAHLVCVRVAYMWNTYLIEVSISLSSHLISDLQCRFYDQPISSSSSSIVVYLQFDIHFSEYEAMYDSRWWCAGIEIDGVKHKLWIFIFMERGQYSLGVRCGEK